MKKKKRIKWENIMIILISIGGLILLRDFITLATSRIGYTRLGIVSVTGVLVFLKVCIEELVYED